MPQSPISSTFPPPDVVPDAVLVVDDDEATRKLTQRWLGKSGLGLFEADRGEAALELLREHADEIAVIVLDVMMPGLDGYEVLERLRADVRTRSIPVILLTAHATADADVVRGIEGGAVDHLSKPYSGPVLLARVNALARQRRDAFLVAARLAHAERQATTDPLTGLQNRRAFEAQLAREVAFAARHRAPFALLMLDVDKFKIVNDTWGHPEGDRVLVHVSRLLVDTLRTSDYVFRLGGEEFVALLRGADRSAATHTAERVVHALRSTPIAIAGELRRITASLGVAVADAATDFDCKGLLERADGALYAAKRAGRDRVEVEPALRPENDG